MLELCGRLLLPLLLREELCLTDGVMLFGKVPEQWVASIPKPFIPIHVALHPAMNGDRVVDPSESWLKR